LRRNPTMRMKARKANKDDCRLCHKGRGIWEECDNPNFYICDLCFYYMERTWDFDRFKRRVS
jgi:hypothetical protein